jgi:hypothetical protein
MRKTKEFIKRDIAGEILLVPTGQTAQEFNGMITLQGIGEFIWDHLEEAQNIDELLDMIQGEYDVDRATASGDALAFIMQLLRSGMIKPDGKDW